MNERENVLFYDTSSLTETDGIILRADKDYIQNALEQRFPKETFSVESVTLNRSGTYKRGIKKIVGLPDYIDVRLIHITGRRTEKITVWVPLCWNDRFIGTGGGGIATGGEFYISRPDNTERGMTLPKALSNGFASATTDGGNPEREWGLNPETGKRDNERLDNWAGRSTHFMTLVGKTVTEILHERPVRFAYFHGGSGGGRQAMVEAQRYPEDYNGIWATCPAINWTSFLPMGLWPLAVMNSARHVLSAKKLMVFAEAAQNSIGGREEYYRRTEPADFDPLSIVGTNGITEKDAAVMQRLWNGPRDENGERIWYSFRPGVVFWAKLLPITAMYFNIFRKPRPFPLSRTYLRWVTENDGGKYNAITEDELIRLMRRGTAELSEYAADIADLSDFVGRGGRLIIDHGTDDPLIPVDGTLDYLKRVEKAVGREKTLSFIRAYITPGDGHGNCRYHAPGITESTGMTALTAWVEKGIAPDELPTVLVNGKRNIIRKSSVKPYNI